MVSLAHFYLGNFFALIIFYFACNCIFQDELWVSENFDKLLVVNKTRIDPKSYRQLVGQRLRKQIEFLIRHPDCLELSLVVFIKFLASKLEIC